MRHSCLECAMKHLAQAMILALESQKGYPIHRRWAIGHMAEAEDELLESYPAEAVQIRAHRLAYRASWDTDTLYHVPYTELVERLENLAQQAMQFEPTVELPDK